MDKSAADIIPCVGWDIAYCGDNGMITIKIMLE
jgi:hypothetical protein